MDVRGFTHDTAGNMTAEGGNGFNYDARNRLAPATSPTTSTSYAHDGLGRRVFKNNPAVRHYADDEQRKVIGEYDAAGTVSETVWLGSTSMGVLRNGATYWIDADQIDTPRAVLDVRRGWCSRRDCSARGSLDVGKTKNSCGTTSFIDPGVKNEFSGIGMKGFLAGRIKASIGGGESATGGCTC